jgi:NAD(P)H-flavin reductase
MTATLPAACPRDARTPIPCVVTRVTRELADTITLELDVTGWPGGFRFQPGQFTMLWLPGAGEVPISISGPVVDPKAEPGAPLARLVHTVRAVGAVTEPLCRVRKGDWLGVRGPYGAPWPMEAARGRDLLIIAGGLGLAPVRPALLEALRRRSDLEKLSLLVGARAPEQLLYPRELERWARRQDLHTLVTVDRAAPGWSGRVGVVGALLADARFEPARTTAFVCGPEVMMRFVARDLEAAGVPRASIFVSLERSMTCAVGLCGKCQLGPAFVCKDGPVLPLDRAAPLLAVREL